MGQRQERSPWPSEVRIIDLRLHKPSTVFQWQPLAYDAAVKCKLRRISFSGPAGGCESLRQAVRGSSQDARAWPAPEGTGGGPGASKGTGGGPGASEGTLHDNTPPT